MLSTENSRYIGKGKLIFNNCIKTNYRVYFCTMRTTIRGTEILSGITFHIDDVQKVLKQEFLCTECGKPVRPIKSTARKKDWHFRHKIKSDQIKCRQTRLHDEAIQILLNATEIRIAKNRRINYIVSSNKKDVNLEDRYISDVAAWHNNSILHFEVFVTHDLTPDKSKYYSDKMIRCVKIDLSDKKLLFAPPEKIKNLVLNDYANKSIYGWEEEMVPINSVSDFWNDFLIFVKWAFLVWVIYRAIKYIFRRQPAYVSSNRKRNHRYHKINSRKF